MKVIQHDPDNGEKNYKNYVINNTKNNFDDETEYY